MSAVAKTVISVINAVFLYFWYWWFLPPLLLNYFGGFVFILLCVISIVANILMWSKAFEKWSPAVGISGIILAVIVILAIIGWVIFGTPLTNAEKLRSQIGDVEQNEFTEVITQLDNAQIPTVDSDLADKQGSKLLGEDAGLGSRAKLGEFTIQSVDGKLVFVAPLEHTGFFKWWEHRSTPGYITVSATDSSDVKYVNSLEDGTPISIRYQTSAFWGDDLKRYLVMDRGYRFTGLTEFAFEIGDDGRPYYIVVTYENTIFWGAPEATGIIIVDPQTGETNWYSLGDVPEWVDRIQPDDFVDKQLDNYGKFVHGVFNFGGTDVLHVSEGMGVVYSGEECYYYTGMTSSGSDNSTVGVYMVNTRTKEAKYFAIAGATENAAMSSAEGVVQAYGYEATYPIPLNVNGVPTYFMELKDAEGLVKNYAMVNIQNYSLVAIGDNIAETKRAYMQQLSSTGNSVVFSSDEAYAYTVTGTISRFSTTVENGNSYYYFIIDNDTSKLYSASYTLSDELAITREGDQVTVKYIDDGNGTISLSSFDNLTFESRVSDDQARKDELSSESANPLDSSKTNNIVDVNPDEAQEQWDSLTDEEKAKLLKSSD